MCGDVNSTSSTMPVTEVQWIGASCGRHSTYTFYRGFRLIVDGVAKNFCLGEFYFVRNSTDQPICIAELQLVWYDASTDSQLASARLYFRPEDTPAGRLANHGQDELLYADQKVVIKCHDMAVWQNSGLQWNCGMLPLCESDFVCVNDKYYLNSNNVAKEKETLKTAREAWMKRDHPRSLHILTFPAYCRYRALKRRLLSGMFLTRAQLTALGGVIAEHKSIRVLFCRDSFHHPSLDKFELSGDNKAPVLKGRPRKKKKLTAQNNVLKKKRFVADIQNHLGNSPAAKRCKVSEEEESAGSDMSEGVQDKIKAPPAMGRKTNGPPPLIKPRIQVNNAEKAETAEIPKVAVQDVPLAKGEHTKIPPPLIPSSKLKADVLCLSQPLQSSQKEISTNISECSRTTPIQKQVFSSNAKLRDVENSMTNKKTVSLMKPHLTDRVRTNVTVIPASSSSSMSESRTSRVPNSLTENKKTSNGTAVTYTHNVDNSRTQPAVQANVHPPTVLSTRPVTTTQGTVSTQLAASTCNVMRNQPVACLQQPISSVQSVPAKSFQNATPISGPISSSVNINDVTKPRFSKENEEKHFRPPSVSEEKKENEMKQMEESILWKKKKKRLRMPGNVKDEVYDDDDEKFFMQTLRDFMRKNNQPLGKLPALGFKKVNLWTMYNTVQKFGGYDAVTGKRLWRRVYDSLGASTTITSAATYTKRHYERLLLPYEKHIRNDLKRQMDEKNPPFADSCGQKELLDKTKKKPGLTVSNSKAVQPSFHADQAVVEKKQNQVMERDRNTRDNIAPVSSQQAIPLRVTSTPDVKRNAMHIAHSQEMKPVITTSAITTASYMQEISPVSVKSITEESKLWRSKSVASTEPLITSSSDRREKVVPVQQFSQEATVTQDRKQHRREEIRSHEETSARTNFVYAKNTVAVGTNLNQAIPPQRVSKVVNDDMRVVPPLQQLNTANKGREIIDLTSEDSPPGVQSRSHTVPQTQKEMQEISKVQRPIIGGGENSRLKHLQQSQIKQEHNDSSKHHSTKELKPKVEGSIVYGVQPYSGQPFNGNKVPSRVHESSPGFTTKKALDEVCPPLKQETSHSKQEKKRHKQARSENLEGCYTRSPSSESVDEHFAEWLRRQSNGQQQHPKSSTRHHYTPELGQLRYNYVSEDLCPPDCSCSLSASRKDEIRAPPPKPKKEHYEEELPFHGMTFYPGRWSPSSMMPDRPDLYISSPSAHLQGPPDALSSHLCTASRIFIPTPPMFSPTYHLGVAPVGAPALITGTDDQLHIHPHCLLGSTYPGTSNSRTPEGTNYPLYSFT